MKKNGLIKNSISVIIAISVSLIFSTSLSFADESVRDNANDVLQSDKGTSGAEYNLYFGQFHMHSQNSACGTGSVENAYSYARDTGKLDFMALTDHSNDFDNNSKGNILDGSCSKEWTSGHEIADKYTDENFVAMYAYEMTWSNGNGHMNTFNTKGFETRDKYTNSGSNTKGVSDYYKILKDKAPEAICQINHPNQGTFGNFDYYDEDIDKIVNLIEAGRGMGLINGKGTCTSNSKWERMEKYFYQALDKGWHLAPTAGQDDHSSKWGTTNTARTVILANKLTRDNIYEALKNRRCYASEDNDLQIKYTLDNAVMGSITGKSSDTCKIVVDYKETGDDKVDKIRVMVDGQKEIAAKSVDNLEGTATFDVPSNYKYYVVEVYEKDNDFAITAPVWIDESIETTKDLYVSKVETSIASGVRAGKSVEISGNIKNNVGDTKYRYTVKDKDGKIVAMQDYSDKNTLEWVPKAAGQYSIVLEVQDSISKASKEINYLVKDDTTIATIYYEGYSTPYIHYCINSVWTKAPGVAMEKTDELSGYSYKAEVDLGEAQDMMVCFNDGNGKWDSNSPDHYVFGAGYYTFSKGKVVQIDNPNPPIVDEEGNKKNEKDPIENEEDNKENEKDPVDNEENNKENNKDPVDNEENNKENDKDPVDNEENNKELVDKVEDNKENDKDPVDKIEDNKENEKDSVDKIEENKENEKDPVDKVDDNKENEKETADKVEDNKENEKETEDKVDNNKESDNEITDIVDKSKEENNANSADEGEYGLFVLILGLSTMTIKFTQKN